MSNTYQLTAEIHQLIDQINQKKGKELRVESDYWFYRNDEYSTIQIAHRGEVESDLSNRESWCLLSELCPDLNPENIQQLLCKLDLGESSGTTGARDWYKMQQDKIAKYNIAELDYKTALDLLFSIQSFKNGEYPQTQAKALSDKWFSLQETDGKPTISLWNSGGVGQIQVLTELKEVLENYLNNNNYDQKN